MAGSVLTRFIDFIEPRLNRRSVAFLLCLLLSALFWLLTSLSKEYVDQIKIPVEYVGLPDELLMANDPAQTVTAEVRGIGFELLWNWAKTGDVKLTIQADPATLPSVMKDNEEFHYVLTNGKNELINTTEDQLEVLSIEPDTVFIRFRPKHLKSVPVKLDGRFSFAKQYDMMNEPSIVPDSVIIIGPKEVVDTIKFVQTEPLTLTDLQESITTEVNLIPFDSNSNIRSSHKAVTVEVNVVEFTEATVTVPITIRKDEKLSVQVFPQEVEIKYLVPLPEFDKVDASQFQASVELTKEVMGNSHLIVSIDRQPDMVKQVRVIPPQVEFIIQR